MIHNKYVWHIEAPGVRSKVGLMTVLKAFGLSEVSFEPSRTKPAKNVTIGKKFFVYSFFCKNSWCVNEFIQKVITILACQSASRKQMNWHTHVNNQLNAFIV